MVFLQCRDCAFGTTSPRSADAHEEDTDHKVLYINDDEVL